MRAIPLIVIMFILMGAASSCQDDPVTPKPGGKDSCDTCIVDTTDTTDTVIVTPNDTTSHDFVWTEYSIPAEASITGCWVFDDTTIWVMGNELYQWSASGYTPIHHFSSGTSIFAFAPTDAWFIYSTILWHKVGETYQEIRLNKAPHNISLDGAFRAAWGTSSNDMFFVGDKGTIVHFDGTNWMKFPKVTQKNLQSVWGSSSTNVWACGYNPSDGQTTLLHFDGSNWTIDPLSLEPREKTGPYLGVWAGDSAGVPVATVVGTLAFRKTADGPWRRDSGRVPNWDADSYIGMGVRGNGPNDLLLAGPGGLIIHWNGSTYKRYDQFFEPGNPFYIAGAASFKGNTAVVAGSKNGSWIAIGRRGK